MKNIALALTALFLTFAPSFVMLAQTGEPVAPLPGTTTATSPPPVAVPTQAPQTQITTTAPVTSATNISVGTLAGQILMWIAAAFSVPIGGLATLWIKRLFTLAGVQVTQQMSEQLNQTLVNGLNAGAVATAERLKNQGPIVIKSAIVADAVKYAQDHRSETIKALGLDPQSGEAVQALKARIETLLVDPKVPTPAAITPPEGKLQPIVQISNP